jgi:hypothetical protein
LEEEEEEEEERDVDVDVRGAVLLLLPFINASEVGLPRKKITCNTSTSTSSTMCSTTRRTLLRGC